MVRIEHTPNDFSSSLCLIASAFLTVAEALGIFLKSESGFGVVHATDRDELEHSLTSDTKPDIAIIDFDLPGLSGLPGTLEIMRIAGKTRVVVMTETSLRYTSARLMGAGAAGVVTRAMPAGAIKAAIGLVAAGEAFAPRDVLPWLVGSSDLREVGSLSDIELAVLRGLCNGKTNAEIAAQHDMTDLAVQSMVRSLCTRMRVHNRTQAALAALTAGLV